MNTAVFGNILKGFQPLWSLMVIIGLGIVLLYAIKILLQRKAKAGEYKDLPYEKNPKFLSTAEKSFYKVLYQVIGKKYLIFAKVRLADIIRVKAGTKDYCGANNKIQSKHIDFIVINPQSLEPVIAVELDDSSHNSDRAKEKDIFKDDIFDACGVRIVRFKAQKAYTVEEIRSGLNIAEPDDKHNISASKTKAKSTTSGFPPTRE